MTKIEFLTYEQLRASVEAENARQAELKPWDPEHRKMFAFTDEGEILIYWAGYEYPYDMDQIKNPEDLIWFIHHIGAKAWKHATAKRISHLIDAVSSKKNWPPYGVCPKPNEMPAAFMGAKREREKMTPAIRYQVLVRDGHRCRSCGSSVSTGAILHVDHILPVSKGGTTDPGNLQTLCSACNLGKKDTA